YTPLFRSGLEGVAPLVEGGLQGGEALGVPEGGALPVAAQLGGLLLEAHLAQQRLHALRGAAGRVFPQGKGHGAPSRPVARRADGPTATSAPVPSGTHPGGGFGRGLASFS